MPSDTAAAGTEIGELDGCRSLFENQGVWSLNYGEQSWTEDDCPISTEIASPTKRKKTTERSSSKRAGESCEITQADGDAMTVEVGDGQVNCSGAEAVWNEYLRRAPDEGAGSGAAMELDGWACVAAAAAQAPHAGGCNAIDGSGSFAVTTGT